MNSNRIILLLVVSVSIAIFAYAFMGTGQKSDKYSEEIQAKRAQKNHKFRTAREASPLSETQKKSFTGLNYFEPNPTFRVQAQLEKLADDSIYAFRTTKKTMRHMKKYAVLKFQINDKPLKMIALRGLDPLTSAMLFVPFTDETSGAETYGAGRYLDLPIPKTDRMTLDFNMAYNPYCAYNQHYECPLPPAENHLNIRIEAGEKVFLNYLFYPYIIC